MNKKAIIFATILLMFFVVGIASVFAEDTEYEYTITVSYYPNNGTKMGEKTYTLWASSVSDAREQATKLCEEEYGKVASCGTPKVTGRTR